jgi:cytochrome c biogenesis protein CcmG/thiol:disulfide interchange protein DsbE
MSTTDVHPPEADEPEGPRRRVRVAPFVALAAALVIGALFVLLAGSKTQTNKEDPYTPLLGKAAPNIVGTTLDGQSFDLSRRRGSWVVVNFFQSSCVPCKQEHPDLVAFQQQQAKTADGAELVTVVFDDDAKSVKSFFQQNGGGGWPVVVDDGSAPVDYGVSKVPETWIISPTGLVVEHIISTVTADGLSAEVQRLREQAGS